MEEINDIVEWKSLNPLERKDDIALYFVSKHYWYGRGGCLGRHDWKPFGEKYFEGMLDKWKESKSYENAN